MLRSFLKSVVLAVSFVVLLGSVQANVRAPMFHRCFTLEMNAGYAWSNWSNYNTLVFEGIPDTTIKSVTWTGKNDKNGFAFGFEARYHFLQRVAAEVGFIDLPTAKYAGVDSTAAPVSSQINSWLLYSAIRLSSYSWHGISLFTKAGIAYRYVKNKASKDGSAYALPLMSLGTAYGFAKDWSADIEYTYIGSEAKYQLPQAHLLRLGVGFSF